MHTTDQPTSRAATAVFAPLAALLEQVGRTHLDAAEWAVLAVRARRVTEDLAAAGILPVHLVIGPDDPPVAVARLLVTASRVAALGHARRTAAVVTRCA